MHNLYTIIYGDGDSGGDGDGDEVAMNNHVFIIYQSRGRSQM